MSISIQWNVPNNLSQTDTYSINVYSSQGTENGPYNQIAFGIPAGSGNTTSTYTDPNGTSSYFYYVTYTPASTGVESGPVLALIQPSIVELRLTNDIYSLLPEVIQVRIDSIESQVRRALDHSLGIVNAYAPVTSYTFNNLPVQHEAAVKFGAIVLVYLELMLTISIRDFSYGVSGISLNVDRGARINTALKAVQDYWNNIMKFVKFVDYPDPQGVGSIALSTPQARVLGILFNSSPL